MTKSLAIAGVIGLLSAGTGSMAVSVAETSRSDCPGMIVCPLTGEDVCADRCPVEAMNTPSAASETADALCGGACPAPAPKPKPGKPDGDKAQRGAAPSEKPVAMKGGSCR